MNNAAGLCLDDVCDIPVSLEFVLLQRSSLSSKEKLPSSVVQQLFGCRMSLHFMLAVTNNRSVHPTVDRDPSAHTSAVEAWIRKSGFIRTREAQKRLELNSLEFHIAVELGIVKPVEIPLSLPPHLQKLASAIMFFDPCELALSEQDRVHIAHNIFLTRKQAAERLGITVAKFDKFRIRAKLRHTDVHQMESSQWLHYRYRQSDVDKLRYLLPQE